MQPTSSEKIKTTSIWSKKFVLEIVRGKGMHTSIRNKFVPEVVKDNGMHTSSSNVVVIGTQHSHATTVSKYKNVTCSLFAFWCLTHPCITQKSNSTIVGARQKTLKLKSGSIRPIRKSSRLLATFKEANPNIEVPTIDLTCDDGELTRTGGIVLRKPAKLTGIVN
jgi:hypothetical protein